MSENGKQSAFPTEEKTEVPDEFKGGYRTVLYPSGGLTKREYFAMQALQGLVANAAFTESFSILGPEYTPEWVKMYHVGNAVALADALLKELEKP